MKKYNSNSVIPRCQGNCSKTNCNCCWDEKQKKINTVVENVNVTMKIANKKISKQKCHQTGMMQPKLITSTPLCTRCKCLSLIHI